MAITADSVKKLIVALGFVPVEGEADVFNKKYAQHDGYILRVDFANKIIDYSDAAFRESAQITLGSKSTSNFAKQENLVVLECVDRLLEKGYSPHSIEVEKVYPSGRGHSGELDILVKDVDGQAFLMIECKTWGKEYTKEAEKMLSSGGQLFTYFKNATSAKFLCLYTSRLSGNKIEYDNSIVVVSEDWKTLSETKDIHECWNKKFKEDGIFEEYASLYDTTHKKLTYSSLVTMKDEDSKKIFHKIKTILRHNGVSDKPNAFNKLLNLFVCKIIDEVTNGNPHDELQFQCWEGLSDEELQMRLNDLYKEGMLRFLEIRVIDHSEKEINSVLDVLGGDEAQKQKIMSMFIETRLKKSPNFAFIEVQDEKTFQLNAKIVREFVELLQKYKFRYEQKHEFLGNFFEDMLNTSMKQEAGQFFTPVPIARFIISSLPLRDFVQRKIDAKSADPLPTVIDYACGSGHFLTEFMSAMQKIIECVDVENATPGIRGKINSWGGHIKFEWAKDYVYGIDFDNRLVKTAKVSAFFNGDGEATIIWGDGLDSFEHSEVYRGKLIETMPNKQDNGQFDILISNPPYSVEAFRRMLKYGAESFDLYSSLTDNSSEIECLFIERMKQLLKEGGLAGVILPSSILSNDGKQIYARARDIIFKYFNVKAIVELGSGTFMETGTNTVVLFLERRPDGDHEKINQAINTFFTNKRDVAVSGIERAFSTYVTNVYSDLCYEDYLSFLNESPSDTMMEHELWRDYVSEFWLPYNDKLSFKEYTRLFEEDFNYIVSMSHSLWIKTNKHPKWEHRNITLPEYKIYALSNADEMQKSYELWLDYATNRNKRLYAHMFMTEKEKMLYFFLTHNQNIVVAKSGQKQDEKAFLGYEFTKRRGYEGIKLLRTGTMLFDENDLSNSQKVSSHILNCFLGKSPIPVDEALSKYVSYSSMSSFFDYGTSRFNKRVNLSKKPSYASKYTSEKIENLLVAIDGNTTRIQTKEMLPSGEIPVVTQDEGVLVSGYYNGSDAITDIPLIVMGDHTCVFKWVDFQFVQGADNTQLLKFDETLILPKYAYYFLTRIDFIGRGYERHFKYVREIKIPLPPFDVQRKIIAEFETVSKEVDKIKENINNAQKSIEVKFIELFGDPVSNPMGWQTKKLADVTTKIGSGATPKGGESSYVTSGTSLIRSMNVYNGYFKYDGLAYINDEQAKQLAGVTVQKNDVLLNITGASVARTCVVPDDVLPARVNQHVAIIRCDSSYLNHIFANAVLTTGSYQQLLISIGEAAGMSRQAITKAQIENFLIILPPVELQIKFTDFYHKANKAIAKHQQSLNEILKKSNEILLKHL